MREFQVELRMTRWGLGCWGPEEGLHQPPGAIRVLLLCNLTVPPGRPFSTGDCSSRSNRARQRPRTPAAARARDVTVQGREAREGTAEVVWDGCDCERVGSWVALAIFACGEHCRHALKGAFAMISKFTF